jgi:hypothetical protein
VTQWQGHDCWRTWFLLECDTAQLFGVTQKHLPLITLSGHNYDPNRLEPYRSGTLIYIEDAPWFDHSERFGYTTRRHRVLGPYVVKPAVQLPVDATPIHKDGKDIIVYEDHSPEVGPWRNGHRHRHPVGDIEGDIDLSFQQIAEEYDFFPFRFRIVRHATWDDERPMHLVDDCQFCR